MMPVTTPGLSVSDTQTRPNNTTAYDAGDVVGQNPGDNLVFTDFAGIGTSHVLILGARMRIDAAAVPSGMGTFRLHLYNAAPTVIADGTAYDLPSGDRSKYLGYITLPTPVDLGATLWSQVDNLNMKVKCASGSKTLYGILETVAGYTPTAQVVKTITLEGIPC